MYIVVGSKKWVVFRFHVSPNRLIVIRVFVRELSRSCRVRFAESVMGNASTKTHLLYQAHFGRLTLPSTDYYTDLKSVLDQSIRIIQVGF